VGTSDEALLAGLATGDREASAAFVRSFFAADAGFAGVGNGGLDRKMIRPKSSCARAAGTDFGREWAVLGSNQ
jgi:hypothetical protein